MTLIREGDELVAVVGRTRAYVLPHIAKLPPEDGHRLRALAKCLYALGIATGRRPGPYRERDAAAFACRFRAAGGKDEQRIGRRPVEPAGRGLRPMRPV